MVETVMKIKQILDTPPQPQDLVCLEGWISSVRSQKKVTFIAMHDTTTFHTFQLVIPSTVSMPENLFTHSTIHVKGHIISSPGRNQSLEMQVVEIRLIGDVSEHDPATYPMSKTKLSMPHMREFPHLSIRTQTKRAVMKICSELSFAMHQFHHNRHISQVFTPTLTRTDCEGAGETFEVVPPKHLSSSSSSTEQTFFKPDTTTHLTVSGQLELETYACGGLGNVYTFGPCFRAERSLTSRHLAEFWMLETEMINVNMENLLDLVESCVSYCIRHILQMCRTELNFLDAQFIGLSTKLQLYAEKSFLRIEYRDAVQRLGVEFGTDLSAEQEKSLIQMLSDVPLPVFVTKYPQSIKAFYMKQNNDQTVESFDLLVPGIGELVGGSMREEDLNKLKQTMTDRNMALEKYKEYLDLRRYGSIVHGGFGLGFSRLVMLCSGMENIRDVVPFPMCFTS